MNDFLFRVAKSLHQKERGEIRLRSFSPLLFIIKNPLCYSHHFILHMTSPADDSSSDKQGGIRPPPVAAMAPPQDRVTVRPSVTATNKNSVSRQSHQHDDDVKETRLASNESHSQVCPDNNSNNSSNNTIKPKRHPLFGHLRPPKSGPARLTRPRPLTTATERSRPKCPSNDDNNKDEQEQEEDDPLGIIKRFVHPHLALFATALEEIKQGRKESHWMWYMFPTPPFLIDGIEVGSTMNRYYALRNDQEAVAFLRFNHPDVDLRHNYLELCQAVEHQLQAGMFLNQIFPYGDDKKVRSSVQLFERIGRDVLQDEVLQTQCRRILDLDDEHGRRHVRVFSARNRRPLSL